MKSIMHTDYWVEIPAGEFLIGISPEQENFISDRMNEQFGKDFFYLWKKRKKEEAPWRPFEQKVVYLDRFYISRFQFTPTQVTAILSDKQVSEILGALEEPDIMKTSSGNRDYSGRTIAAGNHNRAEMVCKTLGVRLPSDLEWEKAARGTDGRLYPWGNEWDLEAGWFYRGRYRTYEEAKGKDRVDAYPRGVSPYEIYGMVGYLPQYVGNFPWPGARGTHPDETTAEMAWIDHMIPFAHKSGEYVSLRPALDRWSKQQWQGYEENK
jgi:formylglycine-generating enzyme required for sulfatase activity